MKQIDRIRSYLAARLPDPALRRSIEDIDAPVSDDAFPSDKARADWEDACDPGDEDDNKED